ncbi:transcriptional regulator domain-containing protein [Flavisphingomonas formosensis]|uniref:transcriptional regulator domain-containing protein n=1 Tax=Flavisphingomonas formosensis TaxID=861534 RepID=UPI0038CD8A0C
MTDPDAFGAIARRGRSALAWEVLRRDPAYRAAYARLSTSPALDAAADPAFVADWGLHFP